VRRWYRFQVVGYVVMPEHVHLLMSEPERSNLATALQALKRRSSSRIRKQAGCRRVWQKRYYDFNVFSARKRTEKLRYMHRNPVKRGLVQNPEDWAWSSYRHYLTGIEGVVEIESHWLARQRERMGIVPRLKHKTHETSGLITPPFAKACGRVGHPPVAKDGHSTHPAR